MAELFIFMKFPDKKRKEKVLLESLQMCETIALHQE